MTKLIFIIILIVLVIALPIYGYVANIVKLCYCDFDVPIKAEIIRVVGILIAPVGIVAGFCDIQDGKENENADNR